MKNRCETFYLKNDNDDRRCVNCNRAANYTHHNYDANGNDYDGCGYCTQCAVKDGMEYDPRDDEVTKVCDFL